MTTASTDRPAPTPAPLGREAVRALLARLRRRLRLQLAMETAAEVAAALAAVGAVLVALDWWFRLGEVARLVLLAIAGVGLAAVLGARAWRRRRASRLDDLALAMTIDRFRPGTGGRIAAVLQLPDLLDLPGSIASPALVRLAVRRAGEALASSDWATLWNRGRTARRGAALVAAALVPVGFALLAPEAARLSAARWLLGSDERWPQRTYLSVVGLDASGRLVAPRDEPIAVEVRSDLAGLERRPGGWLLPGRGAPLALRTKPDHTEAPATVRIRERLADGSTRDDLMVATAPGVFRHELPPSSASSTIELVGGDDWLGPVAIRRVDRPSVADLRLRVKEPGADGPAFREVENRQNPAFLPDTEVELEVVGSEPIASARIEIHPGTPPALARGDARTFSGRWTLQEAATVEVQLVSGETGLASKPTFLSLGLIRDRVPRATVRALGVGARVTPVATIPLSLAATDDLGLAAVRLQAERTTFADEQAEPTTDREAIPVPIASGGDGDGDGARAVLDHQARHDVELQADPPDLGTILRFVVEAEDRCARGAQVGRSNILQMQVVSPDELFYDILIRQRAERSRFVSAVEATEAQSAALAGEPTPEDVTAVLRRLHTTSRQLEQISSRIADTLQEMTLNQVGSPKSHRLLRDGVIDPINALNAGPVEELRGALQAIAGRRAGADPGAARRLHGEVVAEMKVILEQMSQWESFVDVVNQVAEVIKIQRGVLEATEGARDARTEEVFDALP